MLMVMQIVRKTALFFQPQIRTKIMNEGWALLARNPVYAR
jgi:stage V sporulation protein R